MILYIGGVACLSVVYHISCSCLQQYTIIFLEWGCSLCYFSISLNVCVMHIPEDQFKSAKDLLQKAKRIVILSHKNPDGDTVGANLGLKHALSGQWGKSVTSACIDPVSETMDFLPGYYEYVQDFNLGDYDLAMCVDAGATYMLKFNESKPDLFDKTKTQLINVDHHASNNHYGTVNLVDEHAAATVQIVYHFLRYCNLTIDRDIATCLLHGLYFDTGSFMHSNTTAEVYSIAADLIKKGADFRKIVKRQFHTIPLPQMRLWGRVLSRARITEQEAVVSAVKENDFRECGTGPEDLTGAIDLLNAVPETKFSMILSEDMKGNVKGSFRTQDEHVDLSQLASVFGGGGHKKAAGFTLPGRIKEKVVWEIVD